MESLDCRAGGIVVRSVIKCDREQLCKWLNNLILINQSITITPWIHPGWRYPRGHIIRRSTAQDSSRCVPLTQVGIRLLPSAVSTYYPSPQSSVQSALGTNPSCYPQSIHLLLTRSFQAPPGFLVSLRHVLIFFIYLPVCHPSAFSSRLQIHCVCEPQDHVYLVSLSLLFLAASQ